MSHLLSSMLLNVVKKRIIKTRIAVASLLATSLYSAFSVGATFELPPSDSRVVGRIQHHEVVAGETLALIAKQYDIGFLSLMAANKGVDPFLPAEGYVLSIPSRFILPDTPRQGVVINLAELRLYYFEPEEESCSCVSCGDRSSRARYTRDGNDD